jgi:hypothetical protein
MTSRSEAEATLRARADGLAGPEGVERLLQRIAARDAQEAEVLRAALVVVGARAIVDGRGLA